MDLVVQYAVPILFGIVLVFIGAVAFFGYRRRRGWTGIPQLTTKRTIKDTKDAREVTQERQSTKTAWDWLSLLMVPLVLGLITLWFTSQQKDADQRAETERAQNEALQNYLEEMRHLTLEQRLLVRPSSSPLREGHTRLLYASGGGGHTPTDRFRNLLGELTGLDGRGN